MDVDECIDAYAEMSDEIFRKKHHRINAKNGQIQGRFDATALEQSIKRIIMDRGLDENALLADRPDAPCKV